MLLLFLGCLIYAFNYAADSNAYFMLAYVSAVLWMVFGIQALVEHAKGRIARLAVRIVCASLVLAPLCLHYRALDESRDYAIEDYARNMLGSLEPDALVLSRQWEYFTSPAYYLQGVEGVRPDVAVVDRELLLHSWYYQQLEARYPWLIRNSGPEIDAFVRELRKFEHHEVFDSVEMKSRFVEMMRSFVVRNSGTRPVYVTPELLSEMPPEFQAVSSGLAFRVFTDTVYPPVYSTEFSFHPFPKSNPQIEDVRSFYAAAYYNQGNYQASLGDTITGIALLRKALDVKPDLQPASEMLAQLQAGG